MANFILNPPFTYTAPEMVLEWRSFKDLTSNPEAAFVSACCSYSLSTLEVASLLNSPSYALTERKLPDVWRWAVVGLAGVILEEGWEASQQEAKRSATEALSLMVAERSA